jgi:hypothetical protein
MYDEDMRFSLRTLLFFMLIAGPLCAVGWQQWQLFEARRELEAIKIRSVFRGLRPVRPTLSVITNTQTSSEIWEQQKDQITWESFPESQPPERLTPPSAATTAE